MRMTLHINGLTFVSKSTDDISMEAAKLSFYSNIDKLNKLEMGCDDGRFIVIGKQALQNAIMIFSETSSEH